MENKKSKLQYLDGTTMILSGLVYIILGFIFIRYKMEVIQSFRTILIILFSITTVAQVIGFAPMRKKKLTIYSRILPVIINVITLAVIVYQPEKLLGIIPILLGIYVIISGITRIIIYFQYKANDIPWRTLTLIWGISIIGLGIVIIINPLEYILPVANLIGIFFILYGITNIGDGIRNGMPVETKNGFKRRIRFNLPVFLVAMTPHKIFTQINKAFETNELNPEDLIAKKDNKPYDLEVFIHVGEKGTYALGHVDIFFDGTIYTYGCYDESTFKLGGAIADGVLVELHDKDAYIKTSQKKFGKVLFGFGITLTPEQKNQIKAKIEEIHKDLYEWKPLSEVAEEAGLNEKHDDYASFLHSDLHAELYKFKRGAFKTYFVLNTNCVLLADKIIGASGIDVVSINGLITPGTYYEYLNHEFLKKNSNVVSRIAYYDFNKNKEPNNYFGK